MKSDGIVAVDGADVLSGGSWSGAVVNPFIPGTLSARIFDGVSGGGLSVRDIYKLLSVSVQVGEVRELLRRELLWLYEVGGGTRSKLVLSSFISVRDVSRISASRMRAQLENTRRWCEMPALDLAAILRGRGEL